MPVLDAVFVGKIYMPEIWSGPIVPGLPPVQPPGGGGNPPIIWGPPGPWVTPPIANVPGVPGYNPPGPGNPPGFWGPPGPWVTPPIANVPGLPPTQNPPGFGLHPAHPIVLPPPPIDLPPVDPPTQPPDATWKWAWSPSQGWHPAYVPEGGKPQPPPVTVPPPA